MVCGIFTSINNYICRYGKICTSAMTETNKVLSLGSSSDSKLSYTYSSVVIISLSVLVCFFEILLLSVCGCALHFL